MKELEKTKRISISAVIFLLVIVIGFLTIKRPKTPFKVNSEQTLQALLDGTHALTLRDFNSMQDSKFLLVDVRNNFEYSKGHYGNAINVPVSQLLDDSFIERLKKSKNDGTTVILYADQPYAANSAWMLLYQLGYDHVRILSTRTMYNNDKLDLKEVQPDAPEMDYATVLEKAKIAPVKKVNKVVYQSKPQSKTAPETEKKQVKTIPKKKKRMPEGGC